jgi:hypothetical protein
MLKNFFEDQCKALRVGNAENGCCQKRRQDTFAYATTVACKLGPNTFEPLGL